MIWFPKTNIGPQLWIKKQPTPNVPATFSPANWLAAASQDYSPYFTQTSLVAASISVQYVGQLQNEQGFMCVSQIYGVSPSDITSVDVESGQFRSLSKPGDGIRAVYLPKDINDFTYYGCGYAGVAGAGTVVRARNAGRGQETDTIQFVLPTTIDGYAEGVLPKLAPGLAASTFRYNSDADAIVIYWNGMKTDVANDLRIDIVRKFNGFPKAEQRDVLDLVKPRKAFDPKKTIDVIGDLQMSVPMLAGHSLKQMDRVSDQIQEYLPNVGHLFNEGLLKGASTLDGFAG